MNRTSATNFTETHETYVLSVPTIKSTETQLHLQQNERQNQFSNCFLGGGSS